jgi:2-keto-4-pentenoate hydratase/2-oxohepta-3-ene-1,7-dioic acid hydratase in catechol pathway
VKILAPVPHPNKIIGVGLNYKEHIAEWAGMNNKSFAEVAPSEPLIFLKPPTARIGNKGEIEIPASSNRVEYEAELAVVIGKECRNVDAGSAKKYILGYTCANDVTARDIQLKDGQWTRAKGFDTFCPLGPHIVMQKGFSLVSQSPFSDDNDDISDANNLEIKAVLNGKCVQSFNTKDMVFKIEELVSRISDVMTLYPGDVILTGSSVGSSKLSPGDNITIEIEKIGKLENQVI